MTLPRKNLQSSEKPKTKPEWNYRNNWIPLLHRGSVLQGDKQYTLTWGSAVSRGGMEYVGGEVAKCLR